MTMREYQAFFKPLKLFLCIHQKFYVGIVFCYKLSYAVLQKNSLHSNGMTILEQNFRWKKTFKIELTLGWEKNMVNVIRITSKQRDPEYSLNPGKRQYVVGPNADNETHNKKQILFSVLVLCKQISLANNLKRNIDLYLDSPFYFYPSILKLNVFIRKQRKITVV